MESMGSCKKATGSTTNSAVEIDVLCLYAYSNIIHVYKYIYIYYVCACMEEYMVSNVAEIGLM